jgi:hypothetical protein
MELHPLNNYQVGPTVLLHVTEYKFVFCKIVTVYYSISISVSAILKKKTLTNYPIFSLSVCIFIFTKGSLLFHVIFFY